MTEPEQWAVELWRKACHDYGGASIADTPAEWRAVMAIQRAFEEQTRELREAFDEFAMHDRNCLSRKGAHYTEQSCDCGLNDARQALATRQDAPVTENSHEEQ